MFNYGAFVKVIDRRSYGEGICYRPVRPQDCDARRELFGDTTPLARDGLGDIVEYASVMDALRIVDVYNNGPGYDARTARWTGENWDVTEWFDSGSLSDPDREDFHADG